MPLFARRSPNSAERARNRRIAAQSRIEWLGRVACKNGTFDPASYNTLWRASEQAISDTASAEQVGLFWHKYWEFTRISGARTFMTRLASLYDGIKVCLGFGPQNDSPVEVKKALTVSAGQIPFSMQYAAQAGKKIDQDTYASLLRSCAAVQASGATESDIAEFWTLYQKFNEQLEPASISSSTKTLQVRDSVFVGPFIVMGLLALVVFAGTIYVLVQYSNVVANRAYLDKALTGLATANSDLAWFTLPPLAVRAGPLQTVEVSSDVPALATSASAADPASKAVLDVKAKPSNPANAIVAAAVTARPAARATTPNQPSADPDWTAHVDPVTYGEACSARLVAVGRVQDAAEALDAWLVEKNVPSHRQKNGMLIPIRSATECGNLDSAIFPTAYALRFQASLKVDRYAQLLLPTLLGLLGATIFMLRLIISQIKDGTYSPLFYSQAVVRLCLGSFAGFSTALIFSPDSLSALKGLTASGIAFAAGYSVDIVFAFLDKIVGAFPTKEK